MAGFVWWGIIPAGFLLFGRRWFMGLALATVVVFTIFVIAPYPQIAFGLLFLALSLVTAATRLVTQKTALPECNQAA